MRVAAVALLGVIPIAIFVQWSDLRVGGTMASGPYPPLAACLLWGILLPANRVFTRRGLDALQRGELLVVLAVWLAANIVVGRGTLHELLGSLPGAAYYARTGAVHQAVAQDLPDWLAVKDRAAVSHFFEGYGVEVPWNAWARPLLTWTLFFLPFLLANVCLCALFERAWVRDERLSFPLVALPLELLRAPRTANAGRTLRKSFLLGLAVPVVLHGFGAAHAYVPAIPCVPFYNEVSSAIVNPPWTAARPIFLNVYPLLIGLTFLAPTDVSLSVWFFLLLNKAEQVLAAASGWSDGATGSGMPTPPYIEEQSAGAFLAMAALLVWSARRHLRRYALPWSKDRKPDDRPGPLLAAGFLLGIAGTLAWCIVTGLPLWFACGFFGFYLAVALVLGRLMAEGGIPWILAPILPDKLILSLTGSAALSPSAITRLMLQVQHLRDTRQMLAPAVFQSSKLRDEAGYPARSFYALLLVAIVLALVVGTAVALPIYYRYGALGLAPNSDGLQMTADVIPQTAVAHASMRLSGSIRPSPAAAAAMIAGAVATWGMSILRLRAMWWPLHPLGYALTGTLQLGYANKMVLSVFLGWAFKSLTLRFGGARGFRLLRGAAMGMVLGDLLMGGVLKLLDALPGPSGYGIL